MITVFSQIGQLIDGSLNWFIGLNAIWQLAIFLTIVGLVIWFIRARSN